ncbi:MAG: hypothetical protein U5L96_05280 [Owenweeksia sp.]|nr:hypothetical protein [Owenweeksia sp.]
MIAFRCSTRPRPGDEWRLWPYQDVQDFGTPGNIVGFITLDSVKAGDYVLANTTENIGLEEPRKNRALWKFIPILLKTAYTLNFLMIIHPKCR